MPVLKETSQPEASVLRAKRRAPMWLWLSLPIAALAMAGSAAGILLESVYSKETANWTAQAITTDIVNVGVAYPALLLLAFFASRGSLRAYLAWTGVLAYSVYSYSIYAFSIHFGPLFLIYVAVLGMSVYALVGGLVSLDPNRVKASFNSRAPVRSTSTLLIALGTAFYLLWLSAIIPATLDSTTPQELVETGLASNPVHVLDMAVFLPAMVLAGVLLAKGRSLGYVLASTVLGAAILFSLGIVGLQPVLAGRGEMPVWGLAVGIGIVTAVELLVLFRFLGSVDSDADLTRASTGGG